MKTAVWRPEGMTREGNSHSLKGYATFLEGSFEFTSGLLQFECVGVEVFGAFEAEGVVEGLGGFVVAAGFECDRGGVCFLGVFDAGFDEGFAVAAAAASWIDEEVVEDPGSAEAQAGEGGVHLGEGDGLGRFSIGDCAEEDD